jgi:hypothetical protein
LLAKDVQLLLPLLDLLENAQCAIDEVIDVLGRATIEAVLRMSAQRIAGPRQQGKKSDRDIVYHDTQQGRVALKDRELTIDKPRLRRRDPKPSEPAEAEIPAYEARCKHGGLAKRMLEIVMAGVSTRRFNRRDLEGIPSDHGLFKHLWMLKAALNEPSRTVPCREGQGELVSNPAGVASPTFD